MIKATVIRTMKRNDKPKRKRNGKANGREMVKQTVCKFWYWKRNGKGFTTRGF